MAYPYIQEIKDWPIVKVCSHQKQIAASVKKEAAEHIFKLYPGDDLREVLEKTIYAEKYRIRNDEWDIDPDDDYKFWKELGNKVYKCDPLLTPPETARYIEEEVVHDIVSRYVDEILGNFRETFYKATITVAPLLFGRLLDAPKENRARNLFRRAVMEEKMVFEGPIEKIRKLARLGTVVMVPTHISNLDSMMIGYGIHYIGLPAFQYAAGLNLYNNKVFGFFMQRLGAYKLDRRRKNDLYMESLKAFSRENLIRGVHTLFFPGGTRSRSGEIESHLKLGLLGTVIDAQRIAYERSFSEPRKIFVVPVSISYHFILEAASLIDQHLRKTGKEHYIEQDDEFFILSEMMRFLWKMYSKSSEISLSFGNPIDVLGNDVDEKGSSISEDGSIIDLAGAFKKGKKIVEDPKRNKKYTRLLGDRIISEYFSSSIVYASHVVAYTAFEMLLAEHPDADLYSVLKLPPRKVSIDYQAFREKVVRVVETLRLKQTMNEAKLAPHMDLPIDEMILFGLKNLGIYHSKTPLKGKHDKIQTADLKLLYYYHNRLVGYELESIFEHQKEVVPEHSGQ